MKKTPVLEVKHLSVSFDQYSGLFRKKKWEVIRDLSVSVYEKEVVAIVGASGSGKSLLAHAIMGILPYNSSFHGALTYCGKELTLSRIAALRGREIVLVPQSVASLDPLMKVGRQVRKSDKRKQSYEKTTQVLDRYGLPPETQSLYPFELSGGMARRILISTAVMEKPKLVIADEPTPGLHHSAARRVLGHFREIADEGAAVLLITHDLELAAQTADRIVVFYDGTTLEEVQSSAFSDEALLSHPYTKALWRAMPRNGFRVTDSELFKKEM